MKVKCELIKEDSKPGIWYEVYDVSDNCSVSGGFSDKISANDFARLMSKLYGANLKVRVMANKLIH